MTATLWLLAGLTAGIAHFALLRWNTKLYLTDSVARAFGAQAVRMAAMTSLLVFAAGHGASPLLFAALGVVVARPLVMRVMASAP
jgi:F1F0 ATPase subunit 2